MCRCGAEYKGADVEVSAYDDERDRIRWYEGKVWRLDYCGPDRNGNIPLISLNDSSLGVNASPEKVRLVDRATADAVIAHLNEKAR